MLKSNDINYIYFALDTLSNHFMQNSLDEDSLLITFNTSIPLIFAKMLNDKETDNLSLVKFDILNTLFCTLDIYNRYHNEHNL